MISELSLLNEEVIGLRIYISNTINFVERLKDFSSIFSVDDAINTNVYVNTESFL